MDLEYLKKLVEFARKEGLGALEIEDEAVKVKFNFTSSINDTPLARTAGPAPVAAVAPSVPEKRTDLLEVKSPFVGTFYRSSSPNKPAMVDVGQKIRSGQVICIVEAMKIMNEIEADSSGEVVEVCVENESYVEFGQVLFRIKKS